MGKRIARGTRGWRVGLVMLAVALLVAVAACGGSGEGIPPPDPKVEIDLSHPFSGAWKPGLVRHWGKVTGTLTYEGEWALPEGAVITISVLRPIEGVNYYPKEVSYFRRESEYIGSYILERTEQFPVSFAMHCEPCGVGVGQEYMATVHIKGPSGPPRQDGLVEASSFPLINANKTIVIDSNGLAKDIEIPVVPIPTLTGTIEPGEGESTPHNLAGWIDLWDVSQRNEDPILLASDEIEAGRQFPITFSIDYYPEDIDSQGTYVLQAELKRFRGRACHGLYRHKEVYEVITGDNPTHDVQLEIAQVDKWGSEQAAHVTGTVAYASLYGDGNTDPDVEDMEPNYSSEDVDTDPRRIESNKYLHSIDIPTVRYFVDPPLPSPTNPWHLGIVDLSEDCTLAEIQTYGSTPLPFSFSIPFHSSHVDPDSDYAIRAYHSLDWDPHSDRFGGDSLYGETPFRLSPHNLSSHAEVEVHGYERRVIPMQMSELRWHGRGWIPDQPRDE